MKICVYGAASNAIGKTFLDAGHELGEKLAKRGHSLVFGGGSSGMMGAVARGTHDGGGHITGIAPSFFNVDGILYPLCDEIIYTDTMRRRKQKMEEMSDGFIVSPGGIGTFEEFFEILTLKQLGRLSKPIAILNTDGYYDSLLEMLRHTAETNFMSEKNFALFFVSDDIDKVIDYIENPTEIGFDVKELRRL
ncbi:TIGR00730 family Rossman fold protein [uncultured Ruminococcus sp.]|uniref:LOG family protein n=1 Tax=uncultured Ruminococcus sp. TaxID=165186 RepID=UPI00292CCE72|nr:TIGR00730 family Rossman fold protein [uncultured Ruminococcus sp.]